MTAAMRLAAWSAAVSLVTLSALLVVAVKHESRKLFVELQVLEHLRDELNVRWSQLRIEGGFWASHDRVRRDAEERLGMERPVYERIVIVDVRY